MGTCSLSRFLVSPELFGITVVLNLLFWTRLFQHQVIKHDTGYDKPLHLIYIPVLEDRDPQSFQSPDSSLQETDAMLGLDAELRQLGVEKTTYTGSGPDQKRVLNAVINMSENVKAESSKRYRSC